MAKEKTIKLEGVEITKLKTEILLKNMRIFIVCIPIYFLFATFFGVVGVGMPLFMHPEDLEMMWMVPPMGIAGCIAFVLTAVWMMRKTGYIKKELAGRKITEAERAAANQTLRRILVASIAAIILSTTAMLTVVGIATESKRPGDNECRICGRETSLVVGFNMCARCYENFNDALEGE